jgi:hypothetical protein
MSNPFLAPAAKGESPYWLRSWDPVCAAEHLARLSARSKIHAQSSGSWLDLAPRGTPP